MERKELIKRLRRLSPQYWFGMGCWVLYVIVVAIQGDQVTWLKFGLLAMALAGVGWDMLVEEQRRRS